MVDINKIFYKNDTTFTFEKYVTNMKRIFSILEKYEIPLYKEHTVVNLLDHITPTNNKLKTEVNICRSPHSSTFVKSSAYL